MRWENLKEMSCPKCGEALELTRSEDQTDARLVVCSDDDCDFALSIRGIKRVIEKLNTEYDEPDRTYWSWC
jgi:transcription initiation factor IIE alpha subunit